MVEKYLKNIRVVVLLVLTILTVGIFSLVTLPKRLNPEVKLTIVTVTTVLPGAGPADTESLLTNPLEDKLMGVKGLDTINSSSRENVSVIQMQFLSGIDKDKARTDVQTAVDSVTSLPADAKTPTVTAYDFEGSAIWQFSLSSSNSLPSLMRYSQQLKDKIEGLANVDHVSLDGYETQQISVKISPEKIASLGINPLQIANALKTATNAYPAGTVNNSGNNFSLSIDNEINTVEDIRNLVFNVQGRPIKLGEIAEVKEQSQPELQKAYLALQGKTVGRAVTVNVFKNSNADIGKTVSEVEKLVNNEKEIKDGQYQVTTITNTGEDINKQFTDVLGEFRSTLILVFINLLVFLGLRQALIASITIPLTFLLAFGWMSGLGQSINFVSLFALLLAFGTSIDDTIVTVSAMTAYHKNKKLSAIQAGLLVWKDLVVPIWTTTITTVWAFLPLILTTGIIGEFIKPIPITVATTMYSSTAIAWFITLPLIIVFLNPNIPPRVKVFMKGLLVVLATIVVAAISPKNIWLAPIFITYGLLVTVTWKFRPKFKLPATATNILSKGLINLEPLGKKYQKIIRRIISNKKSRVAVLACLAIYAAASYTLVPLGFVKNEFFPKTNGDNLFVNIDLPSGTDRQTVDNETRNILTQLEKTPETKAILAEAGSQMSSSARSQGSNSNSILFSLVLNPKEKRKLSSIEIANQMRTKFANYTKGRLSVIEVGSGPPAGADVQISLSGESLQILDETANKAMAYLNQQPGVINVDKSIKSGTSKIVFVPDKTKMAAAGAGVDNVGLWLRMAASGFTLDTIRLNDKDTDAVFYIDGGNISPEDIGRISIPTSSGSIPLLSLGKLQLENNPTAISHESGKRTVTISAGVMAGYSVSDANKKLLKFTDGIKLPEGYAWKTGGVNDENTKSVTSIFKAMTLSFILIMATMVIEFGSFRQAAIILSLIPFAVAGVFYIFGLTGTPLSFPALIGVMALFGIVVTNAMFIVEKINQNRKTGMNIDDAIAHAGESRLEPIILTSLTSILGLVPITLANALWRGLGGAIISGLLFSGMIMLLYIPVMYKTIFGNEDLSKSNIKKSVV